VIITVWRNEVDLLTIKNDVDDIGDVVETVTRNTIFCNEKSISQSEFYQAHAQGLKPQIKLVIKVADYNKEQVVEYEGVRYRVLRTFKSSSEDIELVLDGDIYGGS
jgi:SPP1 family predicted phage head-tail adaptor